MHYPTIWPVHVDWVEELGGDWGQCSSEHNASFLIQLAKAGLSGTEVSVDMALDTLMHEWAHAMTMEFLQFGTCDHHHAAFAVIFNEIGQHWRHGGGKQAAGRIPVICLRGVIQKEA